LSGLEHIIQVKVYLDVSRIGCSQYGFEGMEVSVCGPGDDAGFDDGRCVESVEPVLSGS